MQIANNQPFIKYPDRSCTYIHTYIHTCAVIVEANGIGDVTLKILDEAVYIQIRTNTMKKCMEWSLPSASPRGQDKKLDRLRWVALVKQPDKEKENGIKTDIAYKLSLSYILPFLEVWVNSNMQTHRHTNIDTHKTHIYISWNKQIVIKTFFQMRKVLKYWPVI